MLRQQIRICKTLIVGKGMLKYLLCYVHVKIQGLSITFLVVVFFKSYIAIFVIQAILIQAALRCTDF